MKKLAMITALVLLILQLPAQKYVTKSGNISFYSSAPLEDIEAHNRQVNAALDTGTGDLVFKVLIRSFQFEKALMQEHFNENYLESHKFPTATFKGKITNLDDMALDQDGTYEAKVEGDLTIHGVTRPVSETGTFTVREGMINGKAEFDVLVEDYDIKIPKTVINNIAESIRISVDVELEPVGS